MTIPGGKKTIAGAAAALLLIVLVLVMRSGRRKREDEERYDEASALRRAMDHTGAPPPPPPVNIAPAKPAPKKKSCGLFGLKCVPIVGDAIKVGEDVTNWQVSQFKAGAQHEANQYVGDSVNRYTSGGG